MEISTAENQKQTGFFEISSDAASGDEGELSTEGQSGAVAAQEEPKALEPEVQYCGRLKNFLGNWQKITSDSVILSWLRGYKIPFVSNPVDHSKPVVRPKSNQEHDDFCASIKSLLKIKAISECSHTKDEFLSSIFLVPKPNGDKRFILNLKRLNKHIKTCHFKMEDYRTASKMMTKHCYMASIDMKDAYFLVPVHSTYKKYLRFKYNDTLYEFNCLPFGLSTAPFVFTKLLKPVMEYLRHRNMMSVIYLDDIFCIGRSYKECNQNVLNTKNLLLQLGFLINYEKSSFLPSTECKFLGFLFNSKEMALKLPKNKIEKIRSELIKFSGIRQCKLRELARFIGLLTSSCPAVQYGWVHTKQLERYKYQCLLHNDDFDQKICIPKNLKNDLTWWLRNIDNSFNPFRFNDFKKEIFSDASGSGWGAFCNEKEASGFWKQDEINTHINVLELKAAFFALKIFANNMYNCEILLRIDNVTAISCINRMGSIKYKHFNSISREIWDWCERRKITVFASYINTIDNYEADYLSRKKFTDTEWELCDTAYQKIYEYFGQADVDLFASRTNAKCTVYVSWKNDPDAWVVDAFTISWSKMFFYAFPPFSLILRMLQKIISDEAEGIVVVPYWPTQPWFPLLNKLIISKSLHFGPDINLLSSPFRSVHSLHETLTLVAVRLSGKRYKNSLCHLDL